MIFRCTARFVHAFDALTAPEQAGVLQALRGFRTLPRMPSHTARVVRDLRSKAADGDVWCMRTETLAITYSVLSDAHPEHTVCVLRNIGGMQTA